MSRLVQWITNQNGRWALTVPPIAAPVAPKPVVVQYVAPAPQASADKMAWADKHQAKFRYSDKSYIDKEINELAFSGDLPSWCRNRQVNRGYDNLKTSLRTSLRFRR